jgi:uncharacterized DUF497 family protein
MRYEWDEKKAESNRRKHGIGFERCARFLWEEAYIRTDSRRDYGEVRRIALGPIDAELYSMVYTRRGIYVRIISLRKASERERRGYEEKIKNTEED